MPHLIAVMTHPDGRLSFFNDAAFGIAATRAQLEAYAIRLGLGTVTEPGEGVHHLRSSGYVRVNRGDVAAILDLAAIGPDYLPGHAHAGSGRGELQGYINADTNFCCTSANRSKWPANRLKTSSRAPLCSPARTMLT